MESNERLRREIAHLSQLIAGNSAGNSSTYTSSTTSVPYNNVIRQNVYARTNPHSLVNYNRNLSLTMRRAPQYPNPFRVSFGSDYINRVFPLPRVLNAVSRPPVSNSSRANLLNELTDNTSSRRKVSGRRNTRFVYNAKDKQRSRNRTSTQVSSNSSSSGSNLLQESISRQLTSFSSIPITSEVGTSSGSTRLFNTVPCLVPVVSVDPLQSSTQIQISRIRPHVNPAHSSFQLLQQNLVVYGVQTAPDFGDSGNYIHGAYAITSDVKADLSITAATPSHSQVTGSKSVTENNAQCTVKTKYKLDRRTKRLSSPLKSFRRRSISNKQLDTTKTKLFKRYSMRLVTPPKVKPIRNTSSYTYQYYLKKYTTLAHRQSYRRHVRKLLYKPAGAISRSGAVTGCKPKSIVHINGSKYLTKNNGKSLKRVKPNSPAVVNISGEKFIKKNGGRSLKRLREASFSISTPSSQSWGARLAHRAITRSKLTLSQRSWKKKRYCAFFNRFGECKREQDGSCPYIHEKKQVMICPRYIVGKCTASECKLSHDKNFGRMPPCQFFNKSNCSRENCPYPHVKSIPLPKKSSKLDGQADVKSSSTKRKPSLRKERLSPRKPKENKISTKDKEPKSRYYDRLPDSQPIVSIIPRRIPFKIDKPENSTATNADCSAGIVSSPAADVSLSKAEDVFSDEKLEAETFQCSRRARLLDRVSRLVDRVKKKESVAPHYLPFSSPFPE